MDYFLRRTGIPANFGITVALGFIVGAAIAGQTFYMFTIDNLRQFAMLKAMGMGNLRIVGMVLLQAAVVGGRGYGLGIGSAATFGHLTSTSSKLAFYMPWQVLAGTAAAVVLMLIGSSALCLRRVLTVEPALVFQA
jgi:putative ABC transport system permease protein